MLAERSPYVIAGANRGQLEFSCGTGLYGRSLEKSLFFRDLYIYISRLTGIYGIQIIFGHDKDYSDASRNRELYLKNTRTLRRYGYRTVRTYGTVPYITVRYLNTIHVKVS